MKKPVETTDITATPEAIRFSPKLIREQRRKTFIGGVFGVVASMVAIIDALDAIRTHRMVDVGPSHGHLMWPPSLVLLVTLPLLVGSVWVAWSNRRRRDAH